MELGTFGENSSDMFSRLLLVYTKKEQEQLEVPLRIGYGTLIGKH